MRKVVLLFALTALTGCAGADLTEHPDVSVGPPDAKHALEATDISLPMPLSRSEVDYLGLNGIEKGFRIHQIRSEVLLIEVFDMYCIHCQRAAPIMNALYELNQSSGHGKSLKMIGIGRGNSDTEVSVFREKYAVKFPLFSDRDLSVTRDLRASGQGTPHFLVIRMEPQNRMRVVYTRTGLFKDPHQFLDMVLTQSGLKQE